jgi:hypothetical protein
MGTSLFERFMILLCIILALWLFHSSKVREAEQKRITVEVPCAPDREYGEPLGDHAD